MIWRFKVFESLGDLVMLNLKQFLVMLAKGDIGALGSDGADTTRVEAEANQLRDNGGFAKGSDARLVLKHVKGGEDLKLQHFLLVATLEGHGDLDQVRGLCNHIVRLWAALLA